MKTDLPVTKWFGKKTSFSNRHTPRGSKIHNQYFLKIRMLEMKIDFSDFFFKIKLEVF